VTVLQTSSEARKETLGVHLKKTGCAAFIGRLLCKIINHNHAPHNHKTILKYNYFITLCVINSEITSLALVLKMQDFRI